MPALSEDAPAARRAIGLTLCTDFDGTITHRDTTPYILQQACLAQPEATRGAYQRELEGLVAQYVTEMARFLEHTEDARRKAKNPDAPPQFELDALRTFLLEYGAIEKSVLQIASDRALLQGISAQALETAGMQIQVREDCMAAMNLADRIDVISSNMCDYMLLHALATLPTREKPIRLTANSLELDDNCMTTGAMQWRVIASQDKADCVRQRKAQARRRECVIFTGDDWNDLLAMVEADVGILLAPSADSAVVRICKSFGIDIQSMDEAGGLLQCKEIAARALKEQRCVLFRAQDWQEIGAAFKALH